MEIGQGNLMGGKESQEQTTESEIHTVPLLGSHKNTKLTAVTYLQVTWYRHMQAYAWLLSLFKVFYCIEVCDPLWVKFSGEYLLLYLARGCPIVLLSSAAKIVFALLNCFWAFVWGHLTKIRCAVWVWVQAPILFCLSRLLFASKHGLTLHYMTVSKVE